MKDMSYEILVSNDQIYFCDDVVISSKGEVYVSDATEFKVQGPESVLLACQCSILAVFFPTSVSCFMKCTLGWNNLKSTEVHTFD